MYPANSDLREGCIPKTSFKCISLIIDNYTITIFSNGIKLKKQNKTKQILHQVDLHSVFTVWVLRIPVQLDKKKEPDDFTGFFKYIFRT